MPAARARRRREVVVHVEERRPRNVALEVELTSAGRRSELPSAIDELVAHTRSVTRTRLGGVLDREQKGASYETDPYRRPRRDRRRSRGARGSRTSGPRR